MEQYLFYRTLHKLFQTFAARACRYSFFAFLKLCSLGILPARFQNLFSDRILVRTQKRQILFHSLYKLMFYPGNSFLVDVSPPFAPRSFNVVGSLKYLIVILIFALLKHWLREGKPPPELLLSCIFSFSSF